MEYLFDRLSKALAEGSSRREVLRQIGRGMTGVVLLSLGLKTAWAQEDSEAIAGEEDFRAIAAKSCPSNLPACPPKQRCKSGGCTCLSRLNGAGACVHTKGVSCSSAPTCTSDTTCTGGTVCVKNCCSDGKPRCITPC